MLGKSVDLMLSKLVFYAQLTATDLKARGGDVREEHGPEGERGQY